jgi:hypothetical protein
MEAMEHSEAVQLGAAERYLLGELSPGLRDEFEEHFFGCLECAQEVRAGATFIDGAREVLSLERDSAPAPISSKEPSRRWLASFLRPAILTPALALLFLIVAYQNMIVIPGLTRVVSESSTPQTLRSFSLVTANSRGGGPLSITVPRDKPFSLFVDINPENKFDFYTCDLESESGTLIVSSKISGEEAKESVQLLMPPSRLTVGKYILVVRGHKSAGEASLEVARYPFTLDFYK